MAKRTKFNNKPNKTIITPFVPGNELWRRRLIHGRPPIYETAQHLLEVSLEYFKWVEDNPLYEQKAFPYMGDITLTNVKKMRAMTFDGLHIFLGISNDTWNNYKKRGTDFLEVTSFVERFIREQKFTGAAAGLLNANIIARDLGLADKREHSGPNGAPIQTINSDMSPKDAAQLYAQMIKGEKE